MVPGNYFNRMKKITEHDIPRLFIRMESIVQHLPPPMTSLIVRDYGKDPYLILVSCLLSLRARDVITYPVSQELFSYARTPEEMVRLPLSTIAQIIKPIGFYQRKAQILHEVSQELLQRFNGMVPHTQQELLSIKHIGRKTANLVVSCAFDIPAICVDAHVHRIANHLGLVRTTTPEQTEHALERIVPKKFWSRVNYLLVVWGQNVCKPHGKRCSCWQALERLGAQ